MYQPPSAPLVAPAECGRIVWSSVVLAAILMLATLPGRTQGLGLITEPMLADLKVDRITYASINLWATLIGSAFCLPAGWLLDRFGLRLTTTAILLLLGATVWAMSGQAGGEMLFTYVLLTRALGQSALSVSSITAAGKAAGPRPEMTMGVYSVLLSIFFMIAFVVVGGIVRTSGWRTAWMQVGLALLLGVAPLTFFILKDDFRGSGEMTAAPAGAGLTLAQALRTPVFWVFGGAIALFGLVSSGIGLFNEAVLAERGFDAGAYHSFLAIMAIVSLPGQFLCGWLSKRLSLSRLLGVAMLLYAAALAAVPVLQTKTQLWIFAAVFGFSAGMIAVVFFAVWSLAFGRAFLGRIQGAAQMLSVFASSLGPLVFAQCHARFASYTPLLLTLAPVVLLFGIAAWLTKIKPLPADNMP
jgi:MFS family permease